MAPLVLVVDAAAVAAAFCFHAGTDGEAAVADTAAAPPTADDDDDEVNTFDEMPDNNPPVLPPNDTAPLLFIFNPAEAVPEMLAVVLRLAQDATPDRAATTEPAVWPAGFGVLLLAPSAEPPSELSGSG